MSFLFKQVATSSAATSGKRLWFSHVDWYLFSAALAIALFGLVTMRSFAEENGFFEKQVVWIGLAVLVFFIASIPEYRFLRRTQVIMILYASTIFTLGLIYLIGTIAKGAQSWFNLGVFAIQPSEPAKLVLIALLSKYFARRHIGIAHIHHILISGAYAFTLCLLVFFQPDLGSAIILASIWLGLVLVSGISWKHLAALMITAAMIAGGLWQYGLESYQKQRILTFLHPLTDIQGAGYNAYQSTVAVGSGEVLGKGIGYGTQSKLRFLPEYETDFIFAAYAEEWGFIGVLILFGLFGIIITRILAFALRAADNFDSLFAAGVAVYFLAQIIIHVGMNVGLLPITGATIPFMSYGGSHLITEFAALGILMGLRRHIRPTPAARDETEIIAVV